MRIDKRITRAAQPRAVAPRMQYTCDGCAWLPCAQRSAACCTRLAVLTHAGFAREQIHERAQLRVFGVRAPPHARRRPARRQPKAIRIRLSAFGTPRPDANSTYAQPGPNMVHTPSLERVDWNLERERQTGGRNCGYSGVRVCVCVMQRPPPPSHTRESCLQRGSYARKDIVPSCISRSPRAQQHHQPRAAAFMIHCARPALRAECVRRQLGSHMCKLSGRGVSDHLMHCARWLRVVAHSRRGACAAPLANAASQTARGVSAA